MYVSLQSPGISEAYLNLSSTSLIILRKKTQQDFYAKKSYDWIKQLGQQLLLEFLMETENEVEQKQHPNQHN